MGVDLDRDDLSFFPLLYWPMDPRENRSFSTRLEQDGRLHAQRRHHPVRHARSDAWRRARRIVAGEQTLRRLLAKLDLPPLEPVPSDHVLTKTFYLLRGFSRPLGRRESLGRGACRPPAPNPAPARGGDGVSPVIIGGNDWAAAWAVDAQGRPLADVRRAATSSARWRTASASMW